MTEIFSDPFIQKHSKVAAVRRVYDETKNHFVSLGYNFFKPGEMIPTFFWSETRKIPNREAIFTPLSDFQGYEFQVSSSLHRVLMIPPRWECSPGPRVQHRAGLICVLFRTFLRPP